MGEHDREPLDDKVNYIIVGGIAGGTILALGVNRIWEAVNSWWNTRAIRNEPFYQNSKNSNQYSKLISTLEDKDKDIQEILKSKNIDFYKGKTFIENHYYFEILGDREFADDYRKLLNQFVRSHKKEIIKTLQNDSVFTQENGRYMPYGDSFLKVYNGTFDSEIKNHLESLDKFETIQRYKTKDNLMSNLGSCRRTFDNLNFQDFDVFKKIETPEEYFGTTLFFFLMFEPIAKRFMKVANLSNDDLKDLTQRILIIRILRNKYKSKSLEKCEDIDIHLKNLTLARESTFNILNYFAKSV